MDENQASTETVSVEEAESILGGIGLPRLYALINAGFLRKVDGSRPTRLFKDDVIQFGRRIKSKKRLKRARRGASDE